MPSSVVTLTMTASRFTARPLPQHYKNEGFARAANSC
jgi:hypothetical protein